MTYIAGLYIRLSKEDGDKDESNSVTNQKKLLNQFVDTTNIKIHDFYVDDGKSGTNFEREGFIRLKKDVESRKINCVIIKDLSRLGREYIDSGYYIEKYFPLHGIRFISVLDNIDLKCGESASIEVPIKNVMNDYYAKDISKKIRASFDAKRRNGEFIGAFAPYGYKKDSNNKNHLIIDKESSDVVKKIFNYYLEGMGANSIARKLNYLGIIPPSQYKKQQGLNYINTNKLQSTIYWTYATVKRILMNQVYIGNLVQKRSQCISYKIKKRIQLPKEDFIVVENTHEPIIDKDTWNKTQLLLSKKTRTLKNINKINMFAGILKCGDCGRTMAIKRDCNKINQVQYIYYVCRTYRMYGKDKCSSHSIKAYELEDLILNEINEHISRCEITIKDYDTNMEIDLYNNKIKKLKDEKQKILSLKQSIYEDWKLGDLTKKEYQFFNEDYTNQEISLDVKIDNIYSEIDKVKDQLSVNTNFKEVLQKNNKIEKLDRTILLELIDIIRIYDDNTIEIDWNFRP
ncbi:MAG: recombinase family protein [Vallitalea sp.]|jgi:DNA invertase Pin-like site-specific DNA recombinase|nr:recombinase family protein [Vallitalea sp.]